MRLKSELDKCDGCDCEATVYWTSDGQDQEREHSSCDECYSKLFPDEGK